MYISIYQGSVVQHSYHPSPHGQRRPVPLLHSLHSSLVTHNVLEVFDRRPHCSAILRAMFAFLVDGLMSNADGRPTAALAVDCTRSYTIKDGDICDSISAANNVSTYVACMHDELTSFVYATP